MRLPTMGLEIQIAHSVQEIDPEAWDRLGGGRPFTTWRWYRFGEAVLEGDQPFYVLLSRDGEPAARATLWLTRQEPLPIPSRRLRAGVQALLRRWPLLICRSPLAATGGLLFADPALRAEALTAIGKAARSLGRAHHASFLLFDYLEEEQAAWSDWPPGFRALTIADPGTRLVITWPDFDGYLRHLRKSVRKDYRRHRNRAADLGIVVRRHHQPVRTEEALALIRNVEAHHGSEPNPRARAIWEKAGMVEATWLTAEIEERLVGCGLVLGDGDTRFLALLGLDYSVRYAYFQLVYGAIRTVIEEGVRVLRGGGGAYDMKQRLGFQLERDNYVVYAGAGPLFHRLGRWLAPAAGAEEMGVSDDAPRV